MRALHLAGGRSSDCWIGHIATANRDHRQSRHAGSSHPRNQWGESVRSECAGEARSGNFAAFVAGRHRSRIEAESRTAAFQCRHSRSTRTTLGAVKRSPAARYRCSLYNASRRSISPSLVLPASGNRLLSRPPLALTLTLMGVRSVTQTLFDWKSINATRAASQSVKSAAYTLKDARDLVVLAVGYSYLQAIADEARIETAEAQVETAQALYDQAMDRVTAGTSPDIDGLRARVELQTRQQQLIQAKNNFGIRKLTVARVIGLAPGQEFELTDKSPYQPFEGITVDEALKSAYASRSDYQAAIATCAPPNSRGRRQWPAISRRSPLMRTTARQGRIPLTATQVIGPARNTDYSYLSRRQRPR